MKKLFCRKCGLNDVSISYWRSVACMREEVAAKECLGGFLEKNSRFPVVWNVWRVNVPNKLSAEIDGLTVSQLAWGTIA
ncbi:protein of unknown function [Georgfuchsia toluolica]|uniref:Uncharacterized protein n=1 Tax=Georgfuchsia toluolica TaxID=424218 RepID=A0A916J7T2_9PROT|nr:protein of unknown function [Georgfuchsia toluolica]